MENFTIRIKYSNGEITLCVVSYSQVIEMLNGVSKHDQNKFWNGQESIDAPIGNLKLVNMKKIS